MNGYVIWRDEVFLYMIEAAAMNTPGITEDFGWQIWVLTQALIQPNEIKRSANPRDTSYNMQPANNQAHPFLPGDFHSYRVSFFDKSDPKPESNRLTPFIPLGCKVCTDLLSLESAQLSEFSRRLIMPG